MVARINNNEIFLYGDVTTDPFMAGFSAADVVDALQQIGFDQDVTIRLNSGGGDALEGIAIYRVLRNHPGHVTVIVEGCAASAASIAAIGAGEVIMTPSAVFMIHEPSAVMFGGAASDHAKMGSTLDKLAGVYARTYAEHTGSSADEMRALMREETWMTAEEAVALGFATAVEDIASQSDNDNDDEGLAPFAYGVYARAPARLVALAAERGWNARATTTPAKENKTNMATANRGRKRTLNASHKARLVAALEGKDEKLVELLTAFLEKVKEDDKDDSASEQTTNETKKSEPEPSTETDQTEDDKVKAAEDTTEEQKVEPKASTEAEQTEKDKVEPNTAEGDGETDTTTYEEKEDEAKAKDRAEGIRKVVSAAARLSASISVETASDYIDAGFTVAQVQKIVTAKVAASQTSEIQTQVKNTISASSQKIDAMWERQIARLNASRK